MCDSGVHWSRNRNAAQKFAAARWVLHVPFWFFGALGLVVSDSSNNRSQQGSSVNDSTVIPDSMCDS